MPDQMSEPVIIIGAGLAGLVAAYELTRQNIPVTIVDQENEHNLGGQAFWSLGGIFCVNSSMQRRYGVRDSHALALADWMNTAQFDRVPGQKQPEFSSDADSGKAISESDSSTDEDGNKNKDQDPGKVDDQDYWAHQWAEAFVDFATHKMERYLNDMGVKFLTVGWAEKGAGRADGHGNSVPRFHLTWGTGPEIVKAFAEPVVQAASTSTSIGTREANQQHQARQPLVTFHYRHRVDELILDETSGAAIGVRGQILEPTDLARGMASSRTSIDSFSLRGRAVVIATGGIGGNIDAVKRNWPTTRLGPKIPASFVVGVPAHVDGRMLDIASTAGARLTNMDRMWHYTEGLRNWNSIWPAHGIRVIPGPSSLWLDATGHRLPPFLYPGCDTLATLKHICATGHDYSWFVLNRHIVSREFALSGSEQNPDITGKSYLQTLLQRYFSRNGTYAVQDFLKHGEDFVVEDDLPALVEGMNRLARERGGPVLEYDAIHAEILARDMQMDNKYSKDAQAMLIANTRQYWPERFRTAKPHKILDPAAGPLIAVRMNLLTRKSLGGLQTNLEGNVMHVNNQPFPGLYAAGEAAGFGGGGMHGYASLEGTFLGGCIFSGRVVGRALATRISGVSGESRL
ncbi:hypothetical protein A1O1_05571 [Capronia coronata CBS 617.96]|uniref:FAD-dependent oxidoreductase 2 FAD-binding domain-containing protein n=1 Tax=Capronia coronata CBS 617.96 TaxID=1182541 RepID=W9YG35_9EURO|nr:uncharacterized protein A1O1_05571 [Capronia coronata CBS 617.96]EXJ88640.1 hypothetical protein A1O1_05571 [Capronia coronata CBS 617.96]